MRRNLKDRFKTAQEAVTVALAKRSGLNVRFDSEDGEIEVDEDNGEVHLPPLPESIDDEEATLTRSMVDQEAARFRFSDENVRETDEVRNPLERSMLDWIESGRVEREMGKRWKGCRNNFRRAREIMNERDEFPPGDDKFSEMVSYLYERAGGATHKEAKKWVENEEMDEALDELESEMDRTFSGGLDSTKDSINAANSIAEKLGLDFEPPEMPNQGEGEGEEGDGDQEQQGQGGGSGQMEMDGDGDMEAEGGGSGGAGEEGEEDEGSGDDGQGDEEGDEEEQDDGSGGDGGEEEEEQDEGEGDGDGEGEEEEEDEGPSPSHSQASSAADDLSEELQSQVQNGDSPDSIRDKLQEEVEDSVGENYDPGEKASGDYKAFTENDRTLHVREFSDEYLSNHEDDILDRVRKVSSVLSSRMWNEFKATKRMYRRGQEKGRIDDDALWKTGAGSTDVFRRRIPDQDFNTAVSILMDRSGSMGCGDGSKWAKAVDWAACLSDTFEKIDIPHEVLSFTTNDRFQEVRPRGGPYARNNPMEKLIMKRFKEQIQSVIKHWSDLRNDHGGYTPDAEAIRWAAKRLAGRDEERKVMFILCDGISEPGGSKYISGKGNIARGYLDEVVEELEQSPIHLYCIGINDNRAEDIYPHSQVIEDADDLISDVYPDISRMIQQNADKERR